MSKSITIVVTMITNIRNRRDGHDGYLSLIISAFEFQFLEKIKELSHIIFCSGQNKVSLNEK